MVEVGHRVEVFDLRTTFHHDKVTFHNGDLCSNEDLGNCLRNIDAVIHCASPSPLSNSKKLFTLVNVEGTRNIVDLCKLNGVKNLILVSNASVVYSGYSIEGGSEDLPYAKKPLDFFICTKIEQEKMVLEADDPNFNTVAIRPHGIFGPRDPHIIPTAVRLATAGKTKFIIGKGANKVDFTYVDNVVHSLVLAVEKLHMGAAIKGKAFNVTNDEAILFWDFMTRMLTGLNYEAPRYHLPYYLMYFLALLIQVFVFLLSPFKTLRPSLTPTTVALAGTHHYYSCDRAKEELGYEAKVSMDAAIEETLESFQELKNKHSKKKK